MFKNENTTKHKKIGCGGVISVWEGGVWDGLGEVHCGMSGVVLSKYESNLILNKEVMAI